MSAISEFKELCAVVWTPQMGAISQYQRQESERMFIAGYAACFHRVMRNAALPDGEDLKAMAALDQELKDYYRLLGMIPGTRGTERQ